MNKQVGLLADIFGNEITTLYSNIEQVSKALSTADLVIGVAWFLEQSAKLVTREMVSLMQPGGVIVDVAVDQGGSVETCHPTSHEHPTYTVDGVIPMLCRTCRAMPASDFDLCADQRR